MLINTTIRVEIACIRVSPFKSVYVHEFYTEKRVVCDLNKVIKFT